MRKKETNAPGYEGRLLELEAEAKEQRRGMWAE